MYAWYHRLLAVFTALLIASVLLGTFSHITAFFLVEEDPPVLISMHSLDSLGHLRGRANEGSDRALGTLNIHADLRSQFTWNTKIIFVYIAANYTTVKNERNNVVVWDKLLMAKDEALIDLKGERFKYYLEDDGKFLRGKPVSFVFHWSTTPLFGTIWDAEQLSGHSKPHVFPTEYFRRSPVDQKKKRGL